MESFLTNFNQSLIFLFYQKLAWERSIFLFKVDLINLSAKLKHSRGSSWFPNQNLGE